MGEPGNRLPPRVPLSAVRDGNLRGEAGPQAPARTEGGRLSPLSHPSARRCGGRTPAGYRCSALEGHAGPHIHPNEPRAPGRELMEYQRRLALEVNRR